MSESFAIKLMQCVASYGLPVPARQGRTPGYDRLDPYAGVLIGAVEAMPDLTMPELSATFLEAHGVAADPAVLSRFLCRRGFTYTNVWPALSANDLREVI